MLKSIAVLAGLMALGAWTSGVAPSSQPEFQENPDTVEIEMIYDGGTAWRFEPAVIEVKHGDVVRFVQADVSPHNVQFKGTPAEAKLGAAMMGPFLTQKGEAYELTIDDRFAAGVYKYVCTPHEMFGMTAEITVGAR
jgi:plastocyanin